MSDGRTSQVSVPVPFPRAPTRTGIVDPNRRGALFGGSFNESPSVNHVSSFSDLFLYIVIDEELIGMVHSP